MSSLIFLCLPFLWNFSPQILPVLISPELSFLSLQPCETAKRSSMPLVVSGGKSNGEWQAQLCISFFSGILASHVLPAFCIYFFVFKSHFYTFYCQENWSDTIYCIIICNGCLLLNNLLNNLIRQYYKQF